MPGRLSLAVENGLVEIPDGEILVLGATPDSDLSCLNLERTRVLWRYRSDKDKLESRGWHIVEDAMPDVSGVVVFAPRARDAQKALLRQARAATKGPIVVDGAKTDGIDALFKAIRKKAEVTPAFAKAHGKAFAVTGGDFSDWPENVATESPDGWWRGPGVFSADGIDKASALLVKGLPAVIKGRVIDLGAGWGFLSRSILERADVTQLDLVENDRLALAAAQKNVTDPRAVFTCADALKWRPDAGADVVVMNPPFHTGRAGTPALGQDFIRAAASMLRPKGQLWLVANRHLPYESTLDEAFALQQIVEQNAGFKVIRAERPRSPFKG